MSEARIPFRYYLRVRYIECDAQKVVFNSRYGEYVDVGINEFLRAIGVLSDFVAVDLGAEAGHDVVHLSYRVPRRRRRSRDRDSGNRLRAGRRPHRDQAAAAR